MIGMIGLSPIFLKTFANSSSALPLMNSTFSMLFSAFVFKASLTLSSWDSIAMTCSHF